MMKSVTSKWKIWLIIALTVVLCGMIILGVFGLNDSVDYSKSFEVTVGVDQDVDNLAEKAKDIAVEYFDNNEKNYVCYSCQKTEEGLYIFKFKGNPIIDNEAFNKLISDGVNSDKVKVETSVSEIVTSTNRLDEIQAVGLSMAIATVVIFLFILIKDKLKAGVAVLCSSVIAGILTFSLAVLTRIPAYPILAISLCVSLILSGILSTGMVSRFKEEVKKGDKSLSDFDIADLVAKKSGVRYLIMLIALVVVALVLANVVMDYLTFVGLHLLIAGVPAIFSSYVFTPIFWAVVKKNKKN